MSVSAYLSDDVINRLNRPTGKAIGLPAKLYTSEQFFVYEQDYIFARNWVFAVTLDELEQPGTAVPVTIAGRPIVVVNDRKGTIRAFHNVCSHRGTKLVAEPCSRLSMLVCPYHSWGYSLSGDLKATPHVGGRGNNSHPDLNKSEHGLKPVRCEIWHRLVFINLSDEGPSLEEFVAPLVKRWPIDYSRLKLGGMKRFEFKANWKLVVENFLESYHLPWIHPGLNSYSRAEDHYNIFVEPCGSGQASKDFAPGAVDGRLLPQFPDIPSHLKGRAEYLNLFPNLMIGTHPTEFLAISVEPVAPNLTRERLYVFYLDEAMADAYDGVRNRSLESWFEINAEDIDVVQRMQEGRRSPAMAGGLFAPDLEACLQHFQKQIANRILEGERMARNWDEASVAAE
jgi:choline monooxygenase